MQVQRKRMKYQTFPPEYQLQAKEKLKKYDNKKTNTGNSSAIANKKRGCTA